MNNEERAADIYEHLKSREIGECSDEDIELITKALDEAEARGREYALAPIKELVNQQAQDPGLWFILKSNSETRYLQNAIRRLHEVVENHSSEECAAQKPMDPGSVNAFRERARKALDAVDLDWSRNESHDVPSDKKIKEEASAYSWGDDVEFWSFFDGARWALNYKKPPPKCQTKEQLREEQDLTDKLAKENAEGHD